MQKSKIKKIFFILLIMIFLCQFLFSGKIKIATANLYMGNLNKEEVTQQLLTLNADIITILEWRGNNIDKKKFKDYLFIVDEPRNGTHGIAILSKATLNSFGKLVENPVKSPCAMPFASISFNINNKNITIITIHPPPPIKVCENATKKTIKAVQNWIQDGKLKTNVGSGKTNDYLILTGDFNSFSFSKMMKKFKNIGMIDSVKKSKSLYIGTWSPSKYIPKIARIDYIFISKYIKILESNTFKIPGSDHRGVLAEIEIE